VNASASPRPGHVVLVGMMGVGKTTVGRRLAAALDRPFADSDAVIEARTGRTVREIFDTDGERAFRVLEAGVLADAVGAEEPAVIAAAGGVVLDAANRELLGRAGTVVWLRAPVEVLVDRVATGDHRPLLAEDPAGTLDRMEEHRSALYAEVADVVVDASLPVAEVVAEVLDAIRQREAAA
jgi:shikimate kinase